MADQGLASHQAVPNMRKGEALAKAAAELRRNVERMEQCSSEFEAVIRNYINHLTECRTWWLQQLHTDKEKLALAVETAIQETTKCLGQGVHWGGLCGLYLVRSCRCLSTL